MSDVIPTQHDAAILVLREREAQLDGEIQTHSRALELATAQRELLLDLIATLSRKPRARSPRAVSRAVPETAPETCANDPGDASPRPTVFATPSLVEADAA
jgi:hypothetical protein